MLKGEAFNFGLNDGPAAGQTIARLHFHVIPRYTGDVLDSRGGIRQIIPDKARYCEVQSPKSKDQSPKSKHAEQRTQ